MKHLTVIFLLLSLQNLTSQVKIYDGNNSPSEPTKSSNSNTLKLYKLKFEAYEALLAGTSMIYGETNFNDWFGLEVGAGVTYFSLMNYVTMSSQENEYSLLGGGKPIGTNPVGVSYSMYSNKNYSSELGFAFSFFPKIYLDSDPEEGWFFGPQIVFKQFNFSTPSVNNNVTIPQSLSKFNVTGNLGYTIEMSDNLQLEYISGLGISIASDNRNMAYYDSNNIYKNGKVEFSKTRFHVMSGVRVTYTF